MLFPPGALFLFATLLRGVDLPPRPPPPRLFRSSPFDPTPTPVAAGITAADAPDAGVVFEGSHGGGAEKKLVSVSGCALDAHVHVR